MFMNDSKFLKKLFGFCTNAVQICMIFLECSKGMNFLGDCNIYPLPFFRDMNEKAKEQIILDLLFYFAFRAVYRP